MMHVLVWEQQLIECKYPLLVGVRLGASKFVYVHMCFLRLFPNVVAE